jgi:hypothetical protein
MAGRLLEMEQAFGDAWEGQVLMNNEPAESGPE